MHKGGGDFVSCARTRRETGVNAVEKPCRVPGEAQMWKGADVLKGVATSCRVLGRVMSSEVVSHPKSAKGNAGLQQHRVVVSQGKGVRV